MIFERFFNHLESCGGCTEKSQCRYEVVCNYVEGLARKGVVTDSKDFNYPSADSFFSYRAWTGRSARNENWAGVGPCSND